ncbi:MAG: hypothetical protein ACJ77Z_12160 [Thermoleophilaceae bacterium]
MRKQAGRLWLGDWYRDEEPTPPQPVAADPDHGDTFVITPEDDGDAQPPEHRRKVQRRVAGLAAIAVLGAFAFAVSSGGNDKPLASEESQAPPAQAPQTQLPQAQPQVPQVPQGAPRQGFGGPDLAGADATKAAEAALAKYPGNLERVTRGRAGGGYVVHVIQPDGNEVHVLVDEQFKVQGSDANSGPRNFGPGTPG